MSFKKLFLSVLILGILAVTVAGIWYWNSNSYSKGNLKLEIIGPDKADLAQEVEYLIKYKNNGNTRLEDPKLIFQYPENSLVDKERKEIELEDIYPGQEKTKKFGARIIGKEGEAKVARVWLNYRPKNLSARFESNTTQTTIIQDVPLTFEFNLPSIVEPGAETEFNLNYFSNVDYPLTDLRVEAEYPSGFEFSQSDPEGLSETEWDVGLLNKAEGGRIKMEGKLNGEVGEEKVFKGKLGMWQDGEFVTLKESSRGVELGEPSLYITQTVNGKSDYTAVPGETLHYEIYFKNVGEEALSNMFLANKLRGQGFDYDSLKAPQGRFKSGDNSVVFDSRNVSKLQFLGTGEEGKVEFWVDVKENWNFGGDRPSLTNQVFLSQAQEEFTVEVSSDLNLDQVVYLQNEMFRNEGPIPPEVGRGTEYAVMWKPKINFSSVKDVKVESRLPENVELTGKVFPEDATSSLSFDSQTRMLTWDVGELDSSTTTPNISFQIELTPDSSQKGETPTLMKKATITGTDIYTKKEVTATSSAVDTTLLKDTDKEDHGVVQ
ncbi:MAG: hypothetical protein V5A57_01985 [Candidatus Paceibacterota bacterium]